MTYETTFADISDLETMTDLAEQEASSPVDDADDYAETARGLRRILEQRKGRG
jgi:hypothetical protein